MPRSIHSHWCSSFFVISETLPMLLEMSLMTPMSINFINSWTALTRLCRDWANLKFEWLPWHPCNK